jgi:hypothetical protein
MIVIANGVYTRDDVDFVYIPITKCGSTWLKTLFEHNNFKHYLTIEGLQELKEVPELRDKTKLIVLREPLERVISGMYAEENFDLDTIYSREKIFTNFPKDSHTCSMLKYLIGVPLDKTMYFKYENTQSWGVKMQNFLRTIIPDFKENPVTWRNWGHGVSPTTLLDIARNDKVIYNNLMEYLKDDYEFYNKVKWHATS